MISTIGHLKGICFLQTADERLQPPNFKLFLNVPFEIKNIFPFCKKALFKEASDSQTLNIANIGDN